MLEINPIVLETNGAVGVEKVNNIKQEDRFRAWVYEFGGTEKLAIAICVHRNSVQNWIARRAQPNLHAILGILRLSVGKLSLKDIDEGTKLK